MVKKTSEMKHKLRNLTRREVLQDNQSDHDMIPLEPEFPKVSENGNEADNQKRDDVADISSHNGVFPTHPGLRAAIESGSKKYESLCSSNDSGCDESGDTATDPVTPGKKARKESIQEIRDKFAKKLEADGDLNKSLQEYKALSDENSEVKSEREKLRRMEIELSERLGPLVRDTNDSEDIVSRRVKTILTDLNKNLRWRKLGPN